MYAQVMVDIANANVDRLFTYAVPEDLPIQKGQRVLVPFGAGNKQTEGFVLGLSQEEYAGPVRLKTILRTLEPYPVLGEDQLELARWIQGAYGCLLVEALRLMVPAQLRGGRVREKQIRMVYVPETVDLEAALASFQKKDGTLRAPKQHEILELVSHYAGGIRVGDIYGFIPGSGAAVKALMDKGLLQEKGCTVFRSPYGNKPLERDAPRQLNPAQQAAYAAILQGMEARGGTFLLHGVTGSGKTEVYLQAIAKALAAGGTAIVLVPEISLTPQTVGRFRARFGQRIAVLHSRLSPGERFDEWRRIRLGQVDVVIGARSAIFAPLENIRLVVIDEEHESSYRSEITPRYSAQEVARKRCRQWGATLVLGSATPSVTAYLQAEKGRYTLLSMPDRVRDLPMPAVEIADMRAEFAAGNTSIFSGPLYRRLAHCLEAGEQAILFLNRRGYSTFVSCRGCGYVFTCPDCDVSMTYHKQEGMLKCHYCGKSIPVPRVCPQCKKPYIKYFGVGTEQVQQQLLDAFPGVRVLRMDMDTTRGKNAHDAILSAFERGEAQVLIGTQMVAKGLDIPNVTLVGVIAADAALHIPDYRSCERTFQLLTQVSGRAGRSDKPGHVVIQTYTPDHPAIQLAAAHDYAGFYQVEIAKRRAFLFPPYGIFLRALFIGEEEAGLQLRAHAFAKGLEEAVGQAIQQAGGDPRAILFCGDGPAPIRRREGLYRYQALMKLARTAQAGAALKAAYAFAAPQRGDGFGTLEINPSDMF